MWQLFIPLALLAAYVIYHRFLHPLAKIPGPFLASITPLWLVWQCWHQRRPTLDLKLHRKYGSVVRITPDEVIFLDPKYFKTVYGAGTSRPYAKSRFYEAPTDSTQQPGWDKLDMLVETDVDKLRVQKRLAGPVYSFANAKKHEGLIDSNTSRFLKRLRSLTGQPLDLYREIELLNVDTMAEINFAQPYGAMEAGSDGGHMATMDKIWAYWGWLGFLPWLNSLDKNYAPWRRMFQETQPQLPVFPFCMGKMEEYQTAVDGGEKGTSCIHDDFRRLTHERPEFKYNWGTMLSITGLGAGVDTTSWTMATCIAGICMNEQIYKKLESELSDAIETGTIAKDSPVPYDEAANLAYLQACIHEAMRMWPVIAISLGRVVPPEGLKLENHFIPGGYTVGMNPKQLGLSEEVFGPDTHIFRPERWIEASRERKADMETRNFAFGGPSRKCPGKNVAWVALSKNLTALFLSFELSVLNELGGKPGPGGRKWVERGSFPTKWDGMEVELLAR